MDERYVKKRKDEGYKLEKEFQKNHSEVCFILNVIDQYIISGLIKKNVKAMVKSPILINEKKLRNLTQNTVLPITSTDTVLNSHRLTRYLTYPPRNLLMKKRIC